MSSITIVKEIAETASKQEALSSEELSRINEAIEECKRLADLYCTGYNYCKPCPHEVKVLFIFKTMNYHKVYGLTDFAKKIAIRKQLKDSAFALEVK